MKTLYYDVLAIGSGFGSAPIALRLSQKGYKVLVLEKGANIDPEKDFKQSQKPSYLQKYYRQYDGKGFGVTAVEALGGGSGFYLGISLRTPGLVFNTKDSTGRRYWPEGLTREALDPYFIKAENMLDVRQVEDKDVSKNGQIFSAMMNKLDLSSDKTRLAVDNCQKCGFCVAGCTYGAKKSLLLNYIPQAKSYGAKFMTKTEAFSIKVASNIKDYKYEIEAHINGETRIRIFTKVLTLGAGAVGTAKLLLQNRRNLPHISPSLGKHMAGNVFYTAFGKLPKGMPDGEMFRGYGVPGMMSYEFIESHKMLLMPYKTLPIQLMARIRLKVQNKNGEPRAWGVDHAKMMKHFNKRMFILTATGFLQDDVEIKLDQGDNVKITFKPTEDSKRKHEERKHLLRNLLQLSDLEIVEEELVNWKGEPFEGIHYNSTHPVGSARMASRIEHGVVDKNGEVFNYGGMFITDAAAIPSSLIVPPSLTILALAERAADSIFSHLKTSWHV